MTYAVLEMSRETSWRTYTEVLCWRHCMKLAGEHTLKSEKMHDNEDGDEFIGDTCLKEFGFSGSGFLVLDLVHKQLAEWRAPGRPR